MSHNVQTSFTEDIFENNDRFVADYIRRVVGGNHSLDIENEFEFTVATQPVQQRTASLKVYKRPARSHSLVEPGGYWEQKQLERRLYGFRQRSSQDYKLTQLRSKMNYGQLIKFSNDQNENELSEKYSWSDLVVARAT